MVSEFKAAIIGCGGRGQAHAKGYSLCPETQIVACADPVPASAEALKGAFNAGRAYSDYHQMLERERPDIVSVCTWPDLHLEMVLAAVAAGAKAIHCEKPIAPTWGAAREIVGACEKAGVVLTFCHQRRFAAPFIAARNLAQSGAIGDVWRLEGYCSNMFDWGTHWFDMFFFYNNQTPADWVLGQIDASDPRPVFGVPVETHGITYIHYTNDVVGLIVTGKGMSGHCQNRILGSDGVIELQGESRVRLRRGDSAGWETPSLQGLTIHPDATVSTVFDLVDALQTGREPNLSGRKALMATELIFATYESSRRRGRVNLPLVPEDSALLSMLKSGELGKATGALAV